MEDIGIVHGYENSPHQFQFGHGSHAVEDPTSTGKNWRRRSTLQFGHGSDAVEAENKAVIKRLREELQFGHGSDAVEDDNPKEYHRLWEKASIRPRIWRRGGPGKRVTSMAEVINHDAAR